MYTSRPTAASSTSSTSTTATMSSMSSGAPSSVDSRSAFSLHRRTSLSQSNSNFNFNSNANSASSVYPTAYSPAGEADDAPFVGTPFALERPYEYPFPSPDVDSYPNLSKAWTSAAVAASLSHSNTGASGSASAPSTVLAHSLLSSKRFSVEGGLAVTYDSTIPLKKKEQVARENLAKRRATTSAILRPLNIPQEPPIPPALLSREQAGQLSPLLSQLSPRLGMSMPSPRLFRHWKGGENGNRNDTSNRTFK